MELFLAWLIHRHEVAFSVKWTRIMVQYVSKSAGFRFLGLRGPGRCQPATLTGCAYASVRAILAQAHAALHNRISSHMGPHVRNRIFNLNEFKLELRDDCNFAAAGNSTRITCDDPFKVEESSPVNHRHG